MTREEVIICKTYLEDLDKHHTCNEYKLLMQLLEQEPCDDCISRQAVLCKIDKQFDLAKPFKQLIKSMPPVNPAEKQEPCENIGNIYKCSCGYGWDKNKVVRHHFCPNCGRKVQEVEE